MGTPSKQDLAPWGDLDGENVLRHFLGKSLQEIEQMLFSTDQASSYAGDLLWMEAKGFQYYFPSFLHYLQSDHSKEDFGTALSIISSIQFKLEEEPDTIRAIKSQVEDCLLYILANQLKFCMEPDDSSLEGTLCTLKILRKL